MLPVEPGSLETFPFWQNCAAWLLGLLAVLLSGWLVSVKSAVLSLSRIPGIRPEQRKVREIKSVRWLLDRVQETIVCCELGKVFLLVLAIIGLLWAFNLHLQSRLTSTFLQVLGFAITLGIIILFVEIIPTSLAFEYPERVLRFSARPLIVLMKISALDIDPAIGIDNMKTVAQVKDPAERKKVEEDFISGKSPESVKASLKRSGLSSAADEESSALDQLVQEKARIERSIFNLQEKLDMIQKRIRNLDKTEA